MERVFDFLEKYWRSMLGWIFFIGGIVGAIMAVHNSSVWGSAVNFNNTPGGFTNADFLSLIFGFIWGLIMTAGVLAAIVLVGGVIFIVIALLFRSKKQS